MFRAVALLSFAASAIAQTFTIVQPNPDRWWVANSMNTLQWTPCDTSTQGSIPAFNVVISHPDPNTLTSNLTLLGNEPTYECSKTMTPALKPANGYTLMLTNAINTLQVYTSTKFDVKASGAPYPPPLASSTSTSATATATGSSGKSGASALQVSIQGLLATVFVGTAVGAGAMVALL